LRGEDRGGTSQPSWVCLILFYLLAIVFFWVFLSTIFCYFFLWIKVLLINNFAFSIRYFFYLQENTIIDKNWMVAPRSSTRYISNLFLFISVDESLVIDCNLLFIYSCAIMLLLYSLTFQFIICFIVIIYSLLYG